MSPARIAEGLFVDILLGSNKLRAVGARLERTRLEIRATDLKALLRSCQTIIRCWFQNFARECVVVIPEGKPKGDTGTA